MEPASKDTITGIVAKETWTTEDVQELVEKLFDVVDAPGKFKAILGEMESRDPQPTGAAALKIGIARYMLCRFDQALQALSAATDNKDRRWFQGLCYKVLNQYGKAGEEFDRARGRGWDSDQVDLQLVELQALGGDPEAAGKALGKLQRKHGETADYHYLVGLVAEVSGGGEQATEAYEKVLAIDEDHAAANFRLAYYCDLHGEEEQAIELYRKCLSHPPIHANALLNLAVLYEDAGDYDSAISCLKRILATNPGHLRARLFLRDAEASKTMHYDEDQAKRIARRNAVLDIPVTDFELSVRARNCLKKMNIRSLGDLVRTSETELLAYKNFGETSLEEIKDMLAAKGLELGQAIDEDIEFAPAGPSAAAPSVGNEGMLATPIDQVEFSIRSRRALETLRLTVLGDLASHTEAELLACKNFGQTSLNEVRQRLSEYGLKLRETN